MNRVSDFIANHKKAVIIFYVILMILGMIFFLGVPINFNLMDYLPEKANSTRALQIMEEEFQQNVPNLYVMVEDVSVNEAKVIKQSIREVDHVMEVLWLDDTLDLKIPLEVQEASAVEGYYKEGKALYTVTIENGEEQAAIAAVREAVGKECKISGTAADQAEAQALSINESTVAIILLVPILLLILLAVTTSWVEPFLYLLTLSAAVLINLGSNIFLGQISVVTLAAAPILQLAVSLDYAVFLSHSFAEFKSRGMEPKEAMRFAMQSSGKSISASMLTTLFGFLALMFMQFKIGADMGISLVKGVFFSFVCVMTLLPALLLGCSRLIDKTQHRRILPEFKGIGRGIMKIYLPVAVVIGVVAVPCFLAQNSNTFFYGTTEGTEIGTAAYDVEQEFGKMNTMVLLVPKGESEKETLLCQELEELEHVTGIISYVSMVGNKIPSEFLEESIIEQFYSETYARIILTADCEYEGEEAFTMVRSVRELAEKYYPAEDYPEGTYTCGQSANMYDMKVSVERDNQIVNLITILSIYIVLALMTKSWMMPLLLILTIKCSIWLNMAVPYFTGGSLSYLGYLIVSTVQMGATVDYAILLTNTYQENRLSMEKKEAMKKTLGDIFSSIIVSAITLTLAGMCLSWTSSNAIIRVIGVLVGRGAVLALLMVMLLLPTLMVLLDKVIPYTVWRGRKGGKNE